MCEKFIENSERIDYGDRNVTNAGGVVENLLKKNNQTKQQQKIPKHYLSYKTVVNLLIHFHLCSEIVDRNVLGRRTRRAVF